MKSRNFYIGLILFIALCIILWLMRGRIKDAITIRDIKIVKELKETPINHYFDANGKEHYTKEQAQVSSTAAVVGLQAEIKEMARLMKIKPSALLSYNGVGFVDTGTIIAKFVDSFSKLKKIIYLPGGKSDTVERYFEYVDDYMWMEGAVGKNLVEVKYELNDSLTIAVYQKKKWFLARPKTFMDAHLQNPNAYVKGMSGIRVKDKIPGRFNIGPFIGYGITSDGKVSTTGVTFGISLQFGLIRF